MFNDFLLYLKDDGHEAEHTATAAAMAAAWGARLAGLAVAEPLAAHAEYLPPDALDRYHEAWEARNARLGQVFSEGCADFSITTQWHSIKDLRIDRAAVDMIAMHARYADLTVVGQVDPNRPADLVPADLPGQAALLAGRPVLALPYAWASVPIGQRIVIGWDGGREAARAVADAMPFLQAASEVAVLMVDRQGDLPGADISAYLARRGVNVEAVALADSGISVADTLLSTAADRNADLLVMGAYGRSRLREMILGGTTRRILSEMTLPVLLSH